MADSRATTEPRGTAQDGAAAAPATREAPAAPEAPGTGGERRSGRPPRVRAFGWLGWANHAWLTPVSAVLIGPWLLALATDKLGDRGTVLGFLGWDLHADAYPSFMVSVAAVLQLLVLPLVGGHADAATDGRRRRGWLLGTVAAGALVCALLALTSGDDWAAAGLLFLAGALLMGAVDMLYNGTITEIAAPEERDEVSSFGASRGYLGGGALLAVDLLLANFHSALGLSESAAVRICFLLSGIFWAGFGLPAARRLLPSARRGARPRVPVPAQRPAAADAAGPAGMLGQIATGFRLLGRMPQVRRYLIAYLLFADAVTGVVSLASTYLTHELFGNDSDKAAPFLFELILMIQFVAAAGAALSKPLARRLGTRNALVCSLVIWCAVVVYAWAWLRNEPEALVMGVFVGLGLGSNLALSRALFARMIPAGSESVFFSLYEVAANGTAWLAPLVFTVVVNTTGSFRQAILSLIALFAAGLVLLLFTDTGRAEQEALAESAAAAAPGADAEPEPEPAPGS